MWQTEPTLCQAALCDKPGEEASVLVKEFQMIAGPSLIRSVC